MKTLDQVIALLTDIRSRSRGDLPVFIETAMEHAYAVAPFDDVMYVDRPELMGDDLLTDERIPKHIRIAGRWA